MKQRDEPPDERWVNRASFGQNPRAAMIHLVNILCAYVVIYAGVTRGALTVAWTLKRLTAR